MHSVTSACDSCVHRTGRTTCAAFPDGIPDEILVWAGTHYEPLPDQTNSVVYDFLPGMDAKWEEWRAIVEAKVG